jgi:uncharacterized protein YbjQ (UPF0145 family)
MSVGDTLLCPDCFAEVPPQGEMARLAKYYNGLGTDDLLSILEKGTRRHRVYALKAAKDELVSRGGPSADRALVLFSSVPNAEYLEKLIQRQVAIETGVPITGEDRPAGNEAASTAHAPAPRIFLTTEAGLGVAVAERLEIVSSEAAINMRGIRDFLVGNVKTDEVKSLQPLSELQSAKRSVLDSLAQKAGEAGADAVIGVTLRFEQLGAGMNMLLVAANGTAVRLASEEHSGPGTSQGWDTEKAVDVPVYRFEPVSDSSEPDLS